ncbi:hypothetical protein RM780_19590 [Streptomyces sp. DSM 44917]|uniref:Uncharacterized protein n=1 Tax=Streptomyces boetiae TaxID=3075541 RepID=A0ABU2LD09_9ACTN|nr:hypothetical protein [Streptomyces sp. DSM 44917]MDT0309148.1 hypothetical protein [Streptomyces sp. DSM 44917]
MRKSIRLAVPAVAAAMFLLSACGDDDGESPFGAAGGAAGGGQQGGQEGGDQGGGDQGGQQGGGDQGGGDQGGGDQGGGGGGVPTTEQIVGSWAVNPGPASETSGGGATLDVYPDNTVRWEEDAGGDGDICRGPIANGTITVQCTRYGPNTWPDTTANITLNGDQLTVTWSSGATQTMARNDLGGGGIPTMPTMPTVPTFG